MSTPEDQDPNDQLQTVVQDNTLQQTPVAAFDGETIDTLPPKKREAARRVDRRELVRGDAVGRYVILEKLGSGGMGTVYTAYDPRLDRKVAIKVLREAASEDGHQTQARARLLREAHALAKLNHRNIVTVYDVGTVDDEVYVAMEYVRGLALGQWLKREKRTWEEVVTVFRAAALGLAAAHEVGIVHRDFKPDNVIIGDDGEVRVIDFGIARKFGEAQTDRPGEVHANGDSDAFDNAMTLTGTLLGTPAYMAPEQFMATTTDHRTDQFSFAVALYLGLYGYSPFQGHSLKQRIVNIVGGNVLPAPPQSKVPEWLHRAVLRGLESEMDSRYESITAFRDALEIARPWYQVVDQDRLAALEHEANEQFGSRLRMQFGLYGAIAVVLCVAVATFVTGTSVSGTAGYDQILLPGLLSVVIWSFVFAGRSVFLANAYNRRWIHMCIGGSTVFLAHRTMAVVSGQLISDILTTDIFIMATILVLSASLSRVFYVVGGLACALGFVAYFEPSLSRILLDVSGMSWTISTAILWIKKHKEEPVDDSSIAEPLEDPRYAPTIGNVPRKG